MRAAVLTGEGETFMPSVDASTQSADAGSFPIASGLVKEALAIVYNIVNCDKPIVSAINGDATRSNNSWWPRSTFSVRTSVVAPDDVRRPYGVGRAQRRCLLMAVPAISMALFAAGPYVTFSFHRAPLRASTPIHIVFLCTRCQPGRRF